MLIIVGVILVVAGVLVTVLPLGRLPGDIRIVPPCSIDVSNGYAHSHRS